MSPVLFGEIQDRDRGIQSKQYSRGRKCWFFDGIKKDWPSIILSDGSLDQDVLDIRSRFWYDVRPKKWRGGGDTEIRNQRGLEMLSTKIKSAEWGPPGCSWTRKHKQNLGAPWVEQVKLLHKFECEGLGWLDSATFCVQQGQHRDCGYVVGFEGESECQDQFSAYTFALGSPQGFLRFDSIASQAWSGCWRSGQGIRNTPSHGIIIGSW